MYFPYFRGKMYELLALKELITDNEIESKYISPIIEPVKNTTTFRKLLREASKHKFKLNIIINPQVGDFTDKNELLDLIDQNGMYGGLIVDKDIDKSLVQHANLLFYKDLSFNINRDVNLVIPDNMIFKNKFRGNRNLIVFADCFNKQDRNADYAQINEEYFSDYHLLYKNNGYKGFGDYSIIGDNYSESGFAPNAVAIHIVFFDKNQSLKIKHFVSDSNQDIKDPAGKLNEALSKFNDWYKTLEYKSMNKTSALEELEDLFQQKRYPGLGVLKKIEIKHHMELINEYLSKNK